MGLVMLLGVCLTACGEKDDEAALEDINEGASQSAITLSLYLMSEQPVNKCEYDENLVDANGKNDSKMCDACIKEAKKEIKEENVLETCTYQLISKAVNSITEARFKTRIELRFYTEDEYYKALDKAFDERQRLKDLNKLNESKKEEAETAEEEVYKDEDGVVRVKYPTITGYQVDIFYLGGKANYDKYKTYYDPDQPSKNDGVLQRIDNEINNASKDLTTSIPPQFLNNMKSLNGGTYAVPTSKPIGEYTYLLLNKEAMTKALMRNETGSTTYEEYTSLTSEKVQEFLQYVTSDSELSGKYYPIKTNVDSIDLLINNIKYWGVDGEGNLDDSFSVLGGYYGMNDDYLDKDKYANVENLFENEQFVSDIKVLKDYEFNGYYTEQEGKDFAVGYMTGGKDLVEQYGDEYEMIPVAYPRLQEEDIYSDMFGVCTYSSSAGRAMQIVTLLNTDEEFRNILLYGVEGKHYELVEATYPNPDEDDPNKNLLYYDKYGDTIKYVKRLDVDANEVYAMDINKTGNTMIAYPECKNQEDIQKLLYPKTEGDTITKTGYGVIQNQEAKVALDLGFTVTNGTAKTALKEVSALSAVALSKIENAASAEELNAVIEEIRAELAASEAVQSQLACSKGEHDYKAACSVKDNLYCIYYTWLINSKIITVKK